MHRVVHIPFLKEFKDVMLSNVKIYTSRTKKYGGIGDTFKAFGATFEICWTNQLSLKFVAEELYAQEGFKSPEEFIQCWKRLHPRKGFVSKQLVYVHRFERVDE